MLDQILTNSGTQNMTIQSAVVIILSALLMGLVISLVYMYTHRNEEYSAGFTITLIMLPAIIAMIIFLVGNNVARAFSLAGAFSLIRFRSAPGDPKDIAYVFFTLGTGLACGMGYIGYAALFSGILCIVMVILDQIHFGGGKHSQMKLKIVVPEDMDYQGVFDEILREYTSSYKLTRIKTTEFGSLFEISYDITLKNMADSKSFIDKLRCKNGNLNIVMHVREDNPPTVF